MKLYLFAMLAMALLTQCNNSPKSTEQEGNPESTTTVDTQGRQGIQETQRTQTPEKPACVFSDPDTSAAGIQLRNAGSTLNVVGKKAKLEGGTSHAYYSEDKKQLLRLTVHPGDNTNEISVVIIYYADDTKQNNNTLKIASFESEKGIKLGMNKSLVIEKLGTCYEAQDSTADNIVLQYNIITPKDSKTKLLARHNMPMYYATYRFKNELLESFEFGFENP